MATADISQKTSSAMPAHQAPVLQRQLTVLARRRNAQQMTRSVVSAAIPGVALAALSVTLYKFHIISDGPIWAPAAMIGLSVLWGARQGFAKRRGNFVAARDADDALKLDDRLSSALSFVAPGDIRRVERVAAPASRLGRLKGHLLPQTRTSASVAMPETNLVPALVGDASARAAALDPRRVYPLQFDRRAQILTLCSLLFIGSLFLPDAPLLMNAQQQKERTAIMQEGAKLVAVSKEIRKEDKPKEEEVKALNGKLDKLGKKMARGRMTKRAALTEIGELKKKLEDAQKPGSKGQSGSLPQIPEALRQTPLQSEVGRKVQKDLQENKFEEAAKELDKLADRMDKGQVSKDEKNKIANDLDKVAKDLESRGGDANKEAAQKLKDAAQQMRQEKDGAQQPQQPGQQNSQQQQPQGQKNQQGQQNPQQNQPNQQGQQQQPGQQGQQKQGGKQGQQQQQSGQQGGQKQGQQGQKQQAGQQGGQQQGKQGQQQQGSQGQSPQGQGKQGQQGGQGQSPQGKQGQQSQQGSQGQGGQGQQGQGQSGASGAMRDMANGLRQGNGGGSGDMREMLDKLRQAENGANGQGNMSGQGGSGGGRTFGSKGEMGNMITPGKDMKPTDPHGMVGGGPGLGPRNNAQGVNSGGGVSKKKSTRTGDKRRYADAWTDQLTATQKKLSKIKGKWGGSGEVEQLPTKGEGKGGQASTPLYETSESYKKDAEDAVSRESVPPAYKQPVKDYFDTFKE